MCRSIIVDEHNATNQIFQSPLAQLATDTISILEYGLYTLRIHVEGNAGRNKKILIYQNPAFHPFLFSRGTESAFMPTICNDHL